MPKLYLSSTLSDLAAERATVVDAAAATGYIIVYQGYQASEADIQSITSEIIPEVDALVLILGFRYGYRLPGGRSLTEF